MSTSADEAAAPWPAVFDRFPFPAAVVERGTTRLVRVNRQAMKLLCLDGLPVGTEDGPRLGDLVTRPLADLDQDLRIAAGGTALPLVLRRSSGTDRPCTDRSSRHSCQVVPVVLDEGVVERWLVTFGVNVGQLNRFQHLSGELRRANEAAAEERKLRRRMSAELKTLERFAQATAHDLKGPLRHIGTLLPAIEDSMGTELPAESRRLMELTRASAQRGRDLVDALLAHATAVSGEIQPDEVDLDRVVEASVAECRSVLADVPHRVSLVGPLGTVTADRSLVRLLVDNIIGNAIKYRHPDRPLEIEITTGPAQSNSIIEVSDNGLGFDQSDIAKVFEPFVRLDGSVAGHGIGLATCQMICSRHGWRMEASGRLGQGARFKVRRG